MREQMRDGGRSAARANGTRHTRMGGRRALLAVCCAAAGAGVGLAAPAQADLVAAWNANGLTPNVAPPDPVSADVGVGAIDWSEWGGYGFTDNGMGTDVNALPGDPAGHSLAFGGSAGAGTHLDFEFSLTGLQELGVSYAVRRSNLSWPTHTWLWSIDGSTFTEFETVSSPSVSFVWEARELDFSSIAALSDASAVTLRLAPNGSGNGNVILDNIQINASLIPAPGALALLGVVGLACARRRR